MKIINAKIYTMVSEPFMGWVEVLDGKIFSVNKGAFTGTEDASCSPCSDVLDAGGKALLPGFIDAHSHIGLIENALGFEGDDSNEMGDPFTPQLRVIDGINPFDAYFAEARGRGVTCAAVSPGSANPVAGQIFVLKTVGRRVDKMIFKNDKNNEAAGVKFSLGENPKTVYHERNETPMTRMAVAALIRDGLFKAQKYLADLEKHENDSENNDPPDPDIKTEALLPVLKREVKAHFHCHRADDIFTAVRLAEEFNLDLVIVHGTEAHLIAPDLARLGDNVRVICGPLLCDRSKPELAGHSLATPSVLQAHGVTAAISTDHPVVPVQYLPLSAMLAVKGGLDYDNAVKMLTVNAAEILGISARTGSVEAGKDADLQLYDCYETALDLLSEPVWVMVDGQVVS